jgi:predicted RNA binding protein YcfA (HicA-like mRNA interferase family)
MKTPRNISGLELIKALNTLGYSKTVQKGSHIKITTEKNGQHHLSIPNHTPIKIGIFKAIIKQVATHFEKDVDEIMKLLF